jgi:Ras-related GTP-binding protein A/B
METYLANQRANIFSDVAVLIYVFDIESRDVDRDLETYNAIIKALKEHSPTAYVFVLVHKMDLIQSEHRSRLYDERSKLIRDRSEGLDIDTFASSIWDQSLYKAWAGIVHKLIPNLAKIEKFLGILATFTKAEEIILFERTTFLTVTSFVSDIGKMNPNFDRHERLSNIMKTFKHSIAKNTHTTPAVAGFVEMETMTKQFNMFLAQFTENTYIMAVLPPGEARYNVAKMNIIGARDAFTKQADPPAPSDAPKPPSRSESGGVAGTAGEEVEQSGLEGSMGNLSVDE